MRYTLACIFAIVLFSTACSDHVIAPTENEDLTAMHVSSDFINQGLDGIPCARGQLSSGALFEICQPPPVLPGTQPNVLVIYARGFVFPHFPLSIPEDVVDETLGITVREFVVGQGFSYATTSFYTNGLLDPAKAVKDLRELITRFTQLHGRPAQVLLAGVSNGGFQSLLAAEQHPGLFDGALPSCGPVGGIREQIQYWGDIFVLFNHFFPSVVDGAPDGINPAALAHFITLGPAGVGAHILAVLGAGATSDPLNPGPTEMLLSVLAGTPDLGLSAFSAQELMETVAAVMAYNVYSSNDAITKLSGYVYDNADRVYEGLGPVGDAILNAEVTRFQADRNAVAQLEARYRPSGQLRVPAVSLHNERDPIAPFWHQEVYTDERLRTHPDIYETIQVEGFGHCDFAAADWLAALANVQQRLAPHPAVAGGGQ